LLLGLLAVGGVVSCATFMLRDPEKRGLLPDGETAEEIPTTITIVEELPAENWTLAEARRTRTFWLLNVIFTLTWLVVFIPMVHIVPFAIDLGISHFLAAMTISVIGLAGFTGRLAIGPISDRLGRVPSLALCLSLQVLAFVGFTFSTGLSLLYPAAAIFGFSYGGGTALFPALIGDFFGRIAIGAIVGFIFATAGSPAAFGPFIAGYIYDVTKSYHAAFVLSASVNLAALALLFALKKPTRAPS
jgi:MFS family permease